MLKIQDASNGDTLLVVSGRLQADNLSELAAALDVRRCARITLDLKDLVLADEDAVRFLCACERDGIVLRSCPQYIRTWIEREHARR